MAGCFRKTDAGDPEVYFSAVVAVLTRYSAEVAIRVTEPATGLPSKCKWLPSIAELVEACDAAADATNRWRPWGPPPPLALPPPPRKRLSATELDTQFKRLGLVHLRRKVTDERKS